MSSCLCVCGQQHEFVCPSVALYSLCVRVCMCMCMSEFVCVGVREKE